MENKSYIRVAEYKEENGSISFKIVLRDGTEIALEAKNKPTAKKLFLSQAYTALLFRIDDLRKNVLQIKHHYFDSKSRPYLSQDHNWRAAYYVLFDLGKFLERNAKDAYSVCRTIIDNSGILEQLVPGITDLGTAEIKMIIQDIITTAKTICRKTESGGIYNTGEDQQPEQG